MQELFSFHTAGKKKNMDKHFNCLFLKVKKKKKILPLVSRASFLLVVGAGNQICQFDKAQKQDMLSSCLILEGSLQHQIKFKTI